MPFSDLLSDSLPYEIQHFPFEALAHDLMKVSLFISTLNERLSMEQVMQKGKGIYLPP